jgi:hypothetical protein
LLVCLLGLLSSANSCDEPPQVEGDAGPDGSIPGQLTACGAGAAAVAVGVGDPFSPNPALRFEVEAGLQGGRHLDVSLRLTGTFDPDAADVSLTLWHGERALAQHATFEWLLFLPPADHTGDPYCDYPRARMVLATPDGGLLNPADLPPLLGIPMRLEVELRSALGRVRQDFTVSLQDEQP